MPITKTAQRPSGAYLEGTTQVVGSVIQWAALWSPWEATFDLLSWESSTGGVEGTEDDLQSFLYRTEVESHQERFLAAYAEVLTGLLSKEDPPATL
jgi:hypothetical protein